MLWREASELAERSRDVTVATRIKIIPVVEAFLDGKLEDALRIYDIRLREAQEAGVGPNVIPAPVHLYAHLGILEERFEGITGPGRSWRSFRAFANSVLGRHEEAQIGRQEFKSIEDSNDESGHQILLYTLASAVVSADKNLVSKVLPRLASLEACFCIEGSPFSIGRLRGEGAVLLGDGDIALA